ncbi:MAG: ThuA domain-containing protein [Gammaproteobacteria bacterium]
MATPRIDVLLVCGGLFHDFDFVRLQILQRLAKHANVRTHVAHDYSNLDALARAGAIITYTTNVIPNDVQQAALAAFLARGGRWFALHGTNAMVDIDEQGYASCPPVAPRFMQMLGSQFQAHPPKGEFEVHNAQPDHPMVKGIDTFTVDDELYLIDECAPFETLLYANFSGKAMRGFKQRDYSDDVRRPILYRREVGAGEVLYLNLGHCRGHHDMQPLMDWYPEVERGSWSSPVFLDLVERGLDWMAQVRK